MFAQNLKIARQRAGLSQQQLADQIFVSRSAVGKWEAGNGIPNQDNLTALCEALDVSPDWLLTTDEVARIQAERERTKVNRIHLIVSGVLCLALPILYLTITFLLQYYPITNGAHMPVHPGTFMLYDFWRGLLAIPVTIYAATMAMAIVNFTPAVRHLSGKLRLALNWGALALGIVCFVVCIVVAFADAYNMGEWIRLA